MSDAENLVQKLYKCRKCDYSFHDKDFVLSHVILEHLKTCSCCGEPCDHLKDSYKPQSIYCCIQGNHIKDYNNFCPNCQKRMREMIALDDDPESFRRSDSWINLPIDDVLEND